MGNLRSNSLQIPPNLISNTSRLKITRKRSGLAPLQSPQYKKEVFKQSSIDVHKSEINELFIEDSASTSSRTNVQNGRKNAEFSRFKQKIMNQRRVSAADSL